MSWFLLATLSPLLWAICNHIDKVLLGRYFQTDGVGALIIVSALCSGLVTPFIAWADPSVFELGREHVAPILLTAILDLVLLWSYLSAMEKDDSSNVIVYYQLVPLLGVLFGWILLGESISVQQWIAMVVILVGTSFVTFEEVAGRHVFKSRTAGLMLLACTCWAAELALFKVVALEENVWRTLFWKHIVLMVFGMCLFWVIPKYRKSFLAAMRESPRQVLLANLTNEGLYILGTIAYGLAAMKAPVALVLLTETFQSTFVLLIAIAMTKLLPHLATETHTRRHILKKSIAIGITGIGSYWLVTAR